MTPDIDSERQFFEDVASADLSRPVEPEASPPQAPAPREPDEDGHDDAQQQTDAPEPGLASTQEPSRAGGDLSVALRQSRDAEKAARSRAEALESQLSQLLQAMNRPQAPQQPPQEEQPVQIWDDPDKWAGSLVQPVQTELQRTRELYSRRFAEQAHGKEKVDEAYQALDAAISRGEMNRDAVLKSLQQSMDPFGDVMGWFENRPDNAEKRIREQIMEELRASGHQLPARDEAGRFQATQAAPAPASGGTPLPSVNRAMGQSGNQQGAPFSDEDIFNSAPAFGRRRK